MQGNNRRIWMTQKRLERNMTQIELAEMVNVSHQTISEIERGNRRPSGMLAKRLSNVLNIEMDLFYEEEEETA